MRILIIFLFMALQAQAQDNSKVYRISSTGYRYTHNPKDYRCKYPYVRGYAPTFQGLLVGYNFLNKGEVEIGFVTNMNSGLSEIGLTSGYQLVYRRSLVRNLNAIDLELGMYGPFSLGMGVNYNFANDISAWGFKPFIGTSFYHVQLLYGFNLLGKKKRELYDLPQHSLRIRYILPLNAGDERRYYPKPLPTYHKLAGMNTLHPLKRENENTEIRRDIQLR